MKSLGCFKPCGTKNPNNYDELKPRRRNSRQSTATFTNVDFDYTGNTNNFQHLIKTSTTPHRHPQNLNFELNLRTYRNKTKFFGQTAWEYPQAKKYYDPVQLDKPTFGHTHQLSKKGLIDPQANDKLMAGQQPSDTQRQTNFAVSNYLSCDPQNKKYSSKYRVKNVGELKMLLNAKGSS